MSGSFSFGGTVEVTVVVEQPTTAVTIASGEVATVEVRFPGPPGPPGATALGGLVDVDLTTKADGSLLAYDADVSLWRATNVIRENLMDGGNF